MTTLPSPVPERIPAFTALRIKVVRAKPLRPSGPGSARRVDLASAAVLRSATDETPLDEGNVCVSLLCYNAETRAPLDYAGWRGQNALLENALLSLRPVTTGDLLHVRVAYFHCSRKMSQRGVVVRSWSLSIECVCNALASARAGRSPTARLGGGHRGASVRSERGHACRLLKTLRRYRPRSTRYCRRRAASRRHPSSRSPRTSATSPSLTDRPNTPNPSG